MENKFKLNLVLYYCSFIVSSYVSYGIIIESYKYGIEATLLYLYGVVLFWRIYRNRNDS